MKGIFTSLPKTLGEVLQPISLFCVDHDWAVDLQGGPLNELYFTEEDDPRKALFDIVAEKELIYIIFADDGWWEIYCGYPDINSILGSPEQVVMAINIYITNSYI